MLAEKQTTVKGIPQGMWPALSILSLTFATWALFYFYSRNRLLYLGKFYKKEGPKIWDKWGALNIDSILGIYNISENVIRQIRKAIKHTSDITTKAERVEVINRYLAMQNWVKLLQENIPKEYIQSIPQNFSVEIFLNKKEGTPGGKIIPPVYDYSDINKINTMGIEIYYTGSLSKKLSLRQLRIKYLPLIAHQIVLVLQYLRFGYNFLKEGEKINRSIYERAIKEFQRTYSLEKAYKLKNIYLKSLPWRLEAQAVSAGAAKALLRFYKNRKPVMNTSTIKGIVDNVQNKAYDDIEILSEFGIDPIKAEIIYAELAENSTRVFLDGLKSKKVPSGFVRLEKLAINIPTKLE